MDWNVITSNLPLLLYGALMTIKITAVAVSCGFIIGLIVSLARMSNFVIVRLIAKCYVDVIRGTPMLVQIFMIYFALPQIIGTRIDPYIAACAACSIPQAFKASIPPLGNEFIAMLKDSSLVSVIGFEELMRRGQLIIAKTYAATEIWGTVAIIYLCMTIPISRLVAYLERKYNVK